MKAILPALFVLLLLSQSAICYLYPYHNWDMLAYMACVVSMEEENEDSIHVITYRTAQGEVSPEDFSNLTLLNDYRKQNFSDAHFFHSRLKLYWVKPLYVMFVFLLYRCGISLTDATLFPSLLSLIVLGLLLYWWIRKYTSDLPAVLFSSLIILSPPFWDAGRYSTPDALGAVFVTAAFYFILERKKVTAAFVMLWLSILVRIDLALFALMTTCFLAFSRDNTFRTSKRQAALFAGFCVITVLTISVSTGNYGDNVIDYFNTGEHGGIMNYMGKLAGIMPQLRYSHITLFIALLTISLILKPPMNGWKNNFLFPFGLMLISYVVLRFLIFPVLDDRYFISLYLVFSVMAIKNLTMDSRHLSVK